jgi:hypothetical protein
MGEVIDPVCLIHGKRWSAHEGGRCLYCCICFKALTPDECAVDSEGQKWDVCAGRCAEDAGLVGDRIRERLQGEGE